MVGQDGALPIFPLASVVLFPLIRTPLHIFEPRYRQMTEDALAGDRLHRHGRRPARTSSPAMSGEPPIYSIGCVGVIEAAQQLPDGRYNMVLSGTQRFRVLGERPARPENASTGQQRSSCWKTRSLPVSDPPPQRCASRCWTGLANCCEGRTQSARHSSVRCWSSMTRKLVNTLSSSFNFAPREKQALLEANGVHARFEQLSELLGFALAELEAGRTSNSGPLH